MNKDKIFYWLPTAILVIMQGIIPIFTINSANTAKMMADMGYPAYFGPMLAVFKFIGVLAIAIPQVPARFKEWAYGCFSVEFIMAFIALFFLGGISSQLLFPVVFLVILVLSYHFYHKLNGKTI